MFPERLRELRKIKGITQIALSEQLNVSKGTVAMWETGDRLPSIELIVALADFFDVTIDYLWGRSDDPHMTKQFPKIKTPPELESVGVERVVQTGDMPFTPKQVAEIQKMLNDHLRELEKKG